MIAVVLMGLMVLVIVVVVTVVCQPPERWAKKLTGMKDSSAPRKDTVLKP